MRLYGGRVIRKSMKRQLRDAQELRDAIVIDVNSASKYCRVKIQGSTKLVKAWYPENWESAPQYLKPGNAVRINLPGGNKSRIEVAGHGMLLPTTPTGGTITVTPGAPADTVITGANIVASNPASMSLVILNGTYRIDGITYALSGMMMDDSSIAMDRFDLMIDNVGGSVTLAAASAYSYRYDSIVAGVDGIAHVVKGADFTSTASPIPDPPAAPADHVVLGFVLVPPNATKITQGYVGRYYTAPMGTMLSAVPADPVLSWGEMSTAITIGLSDQYGNWIANPSGGGWKFTIAWKKGDDGSISYGSDVANCPASLAVVSTANTVTITYTKTGGAMGESPLFQVTEANMLYGVAVCYIQCLDIAGNAIP
jgi:hypothetical protein